MKVQGKANWKHCGMLNLITFFILTIDYVIGATNKTYIVQTGGFTIAQNCESYCEPNGTTYCTDYSQKCAKCANNLSFLDSSITTLFSTESLIGNCISNEPFGHFIVNKLVKRCMEKCYSCVDEINCQTCKHDYYLTNQKCETKCPTGQYPDANRKCVDCPAGCSVCINENICTKCTDATQFISYEYTTTSSPTLIETESYVCKQKKDKPNFFLQSDVLYTNNDVKIFEQCDNECLTCDGASQNCTQCQAQYEPSQKDVSQFQCIKSCDDGFFYGTKDGKQQCINCSLECKSCENADNCIRCSSKTYKQIDSSGNYQCVEKCKDGYYPDQINLECFPCHQNCKTCFGPTEFNCNDCRLKQFGTNQISYYKVGKYTCQPSKCGDGELTLDTEECDDGNNLNHDGCSSDCKVEKGWNCCIPYDPDNKKWICSKDQDKTIPNTLINLIYYKSKCFTECGDGIRVGPEYGGTESCDTAKGKGCDENCQIISGYSCIGGSTDSKDVCTYQCSDDCLSCKSNYENNQLIGGTCIECQQGLFAYQNKCYQICPENLFHDNTSGLSFCVQFCPSNTLIDGLNCVMECKEGQTRSNNKCFDTCADGTYLYTDPDSGDKSCELCHFSCNTCNGGTNTDCTICENGYKKIELGGGKFQCVILCKGGYKLNQEDPTQCKECLENCDACLPKFYQYNDDCVAECPDGTFQNNDTKVCDKFENPKVQFIFSPEITDNQRIGINQDYKITAIIQSVFPITNMLWSIENQSPTFFEDLKLNTKDIYLRKKFLDYNMKITLKFVAESTKGLTTKYINLQTKIKPIIPIQIKVNDNVSSQLNHLSDVLKITTSSWPTSETLNYSISCVGVQTNNKIDIGSGSSNDNLSVKFIFPFLLVSEKYTITINLWNDNTQVTTTDSINVTTNPVPTRPLDQLFGKAFDMNKLTTQQMDVMVSTVTAKYKGLLSENINYLNKLMQNIYFNQKFSIPLKCRDEICGKQGKCNDSVENIVKCDCGVGYGGKFCTFSTDELNQIKSLGTIINNSISKNGLGEQEYLKIGLNLTFQTDIGKEIFYTIGNQMAQYINNLEGENLNNNYQSYITLIGQITDEQAVLNDATQEELTYFKAIYQNLKILNQKRLNNLNSDNSFLSVQYETNLYSHLRVIKTTDIKSPIDLVVPSQWLLSNKTLASGQRILRNLQVIQDDKINYNLTNILQTELIECEVSIPVSVIKNANLQQVELQLHKWQFNPRQSFVSSPSISNTTLRDMETAFLEIQANVDPKYLLKDQNETHILYKLPRIRSEIDDLTKLSIENPFSCYTFDDNIKNWTNSTCYFQEVTSYYIYCSCWTINTVFIATRNFQIFEEKTSESLRAFIERLITDSGLWMTLIVIFFFLFCWLGTKDTNDPDYIDKKAFRRLTPILSIFFVRYPMKPVRFRIIQVLLTILTQMALESLFYYLLDSNFTSDAIPSYAILSVFLTIPQNYLIGRFALWAQYSESEDKAMLEIQYEKSQGNHQMFTYHVVSSDKEGEAIKKQYLTKQATLQKKASLQTKMKKYMKINKNASVHNSGVFSSEQNNLQSNNSMNLIGQQGDEGRDSIYQLQPKILVMSPDFIQKRVIIFICTTLMIGIAEIAAAVLFIALNENDKASSYFIGSFIIGFILDFVIFDFSVSLAAQYIKAVFRMISYRGIWFKMPKDIRFKNDYVQLIQEINSEKSSMSSKMLSNANYSENKLSHHDEQQQENASEHNFVRNQDRNINNYIDKNNDFQDEEVDDQQQEQFNNNSEDKSSQSNHNF